MDDSNFQMISTAMLESLTEQLEEHLGDDLEVEYTDGIVTITHDEGEFVINAHLPTHQIWMSSPISGSTHFEFIQQSGRWRSIRPPHDYLRGLLASEISRMCDKTFIFDPV